jgi:O-antigen/teichoic acid export membrane protein
MKHPLAAVPVSNSAVSRNEQLPDAPGDRLVRNTFTLLISNGSSVVLGVAFWAVAARLYSKRFVGYGAAEVSAMTFLASFALLNLGTLFPRFLYSAGARAGSFLRTGYAASTSVALVVSVVFLLVTRGDRGYIEPGFLPSLGFVGAVVLWVVFTIEDAALVGLRSPFWVPVENTSFSVAKIALLPIFLTVAPRVGVFSSWVLPVIGCVCAINLYLFLRVIPAHVKLSSGAGVVPEFTVIRRIFLGEYFGGLTLTAMMTLPVLFVAATLGATQVAYFQTPWLAGVSFDGLLFSFATSLIVEASARPSVAPATFRKSVRLASWILVPSVLAILVGAPWFLRILGTSYASHGTRLLQYLALAMPFMGVNVVYITFARLARRVRRVFLVQVSISAIVLSLCYVLIHRWGITGAGLAYLMGQGIVALILFPSVFRQFHDPDMSPSYAPGTMLVNRSRNDTEAHGSDDER